MGSINIMIDGDYSDNAMLKIAAIIKREIDGYKLPFTLRRLDVSINGDAPNAIVQIFTKQPPRKAINMKKVSVQFNLKIPADVKHKAVRDEIRSWLDDVYGVGSTTSIQINDILKPTKQKEVITVATTKAKAKAKPKVAAKKPAKAVKAAKKK